MSALVNDSIVAEYQLLSASDLFDKDWYLRAYKDVAQAQCDPVVHYLKFGTAEGQNPQVYCILNAEHHKLNHIDQSLVGFLSEIIGDER